MSAPRSTAVPTDFRNIFGVIQVHSAPSLGETNCPPGRNSGERYGVACMTVQQALRILKDDGLVISRQGSGMYTHASGSNAP